MISESDRKIVDVVVDTLDPYLFFDDVRVFDAIKKVEQYINTFKLPEGGIEYKFVVEESTDECSINIVLCRWETDREMNKRLLQEEKELQRRKNIQEKEELRERAELKRLQKKYKVG
jgi:hypothetical protein